MTSSLADSVHDWPCEQFVGYGPQRAQQLQLQRASLQQLRLHRLPTSRQATESIKLALCLRCKCGWAACQWSTGSTLFHRGRTRSVQSDSWMLAFDRMELICHLWSCAQVNSVPVVHGSALFQRGETQSLATATVASLNDTSEEASSLVVHYTSPAFANNEVRAVTWRGASPLQPLPVLSHASVVFTR